MRPSTAVRLVILLGVCLQFAPAGAAGEADSPYAYTGREADVSSLIYYRARYYDAQFGRFLQRDPLGLAAGANDYAYVAANPVNSRDPEGLFGSINSINFGLSEGQMESLAREGSAVRDSRLLPVVSAVPLLASGVLALPALTAELPMATLPAAGTLYNAALYAQTAFPASYRTLMAAVGSAAFGFSNTLAKGGSYGDAALGGALSATTGAALGYIGPTVSADLGSWGLVAVRTLGWAGHGYWAPAAAAAIQGKPFSGVNPIEAFVTAGLGGARLSFGPNMAPQLPGVDALSGLTPLDTFARNTLPWTFGAMPAARFTLNDVFRRFPPNIIGGSTTADQGASTTGPSH